MQHLVEFRDPKLVRSLVGHVARTATRPHTIMEVCGGQTHTIVKYGLSTLLEPWVTFVHGPGCPVCVTPETFIDQAIMLARQPDTTLCTFGDMLRVPGSGESLLQARATGACVEVLYTPLDAVRLAERAPERQFVLFAVGFETTTPATAMTVLLANKLGLRNFTLLASHVLVPPAVEAILSAPDHGIDALLAAGHVCAVTGVATYDALAERYRIPIVVTGFEPVDILHGVLSCVQQREAGQAHATNRYRRTVTAAGNLLAQQTVERVFVPTTQPWRGLGPISGGGLSLRPAYAEFDARVRFSLPVLVPPTDAGECISGLVLQGRKKPRECPAFGTRCTPEHPLGAPMVSSEGACAAYARYHGLETQP